MPGGTIKIEGRFKEMGSCFGKFLRFKGILPLNIKKREIIHNLNSSHTG